MNFMNETGSSFISAVDLNLRLR